MFTCQNDMLSFLCKHFSIRKALSDLFHSMTGFQMALHSHLPWDYTEEGLFSGPHFRLPRFDSPLTTPSEVKINGRRILPVINYYIKNALFIKCLYPNLYPVV